MQALTDTLPDRPELMPVLFIGHGNPMNAIVNNHFTQGWEACARTLPRPAAILCISAHWETRGTRVTAMEHPRTIHDFGGFPRPLYDIHYRAPGAPGLAADTIALVRGSEVLPDASWGLDHGTWSVLIRMYPAADIPVYQMSLDTTKAPRAHYELARELASLRRKGVLIIGSGNIVHNLRLADLSDETHPYDWAVEFDSIAATLISDGDHDALIHFDTLGRAAHLSIPTPEHFLPLLYILALQKKDESVSFPVVGMAFRSGSMRAVRIG